MKHFRRSTRALAASLTLMVALAACGGDDDTIDTSADAGDPAAESPSGDNAAAEGSPDEGAATGDFCTDFESLATQFFSAAVGLTVSADPEAPHAIADLGPLAEQVEAAAPDEIAEPLGVFTRGILEAPGALAGVDVQDSAAVQAAFEGIEEPSEEQNAQLDAYVESECGFTMDEIIQQASGEAFTTLTGDFCRDYRTFTQAYVMASFAVLGSYDDPGAENLQPLLDAGQMAEALQAEAPDGIKDALDPFTSGVIAQAEAFGSVDPTDTDALQAASDETSDLTDMDADQIAQLDAYLEPECGYTNESLGADMFGSADESEDD